MSESTERSAHEPPGDKSQSGVKDSVFWRLAGVLIGAQVATGIFALLFSAYFAYNESLGLIENSIRLQLDRVAEEVESRANLDFGIDQLPANLEADLATRFPDPIKIVDISGMVVSEIRPNPSVFPPPSGRPESFPLPEGLTDLLYNDDITVELDRENQGGWALAPVYDSGGLVAGALLVQPLDYSKRTELAGARRAYIQSLVIVVLVAGVLALMIGALFTWRLIKPLRRFTEKVERIRDGDFKARVEVDSSDEFGRLATSINDMADRVDESFEALRAADALRRELVANVGHDLRTPLTAIRGYVDEASRYLSENEPEKSAEALEIASRQGKYLTQLVTDLFELSVLDNAGAALKTEPVPVAELVHDSARGHRAAFAEAQIKFEVQVDDDLPVIEADGVRLLRLLDNLLSNARNHVPAGGAVALDARKEGDAIRLSVRDTGPGMTPEETQNIFNRYYRGDGPRTRGKRGTGLGLPISRAIAEAHKGSLRVESEKGVGSEFIVLIPASLG